MLTATYRHTNIVARDWRALARFYEEIFGCVAVPPERHYRGAALEAGTGLTAAELSGVHLRLPGHGQDGPTLEIFTYTDMAPRVPGAVNRPGLAHIAFEVDDVAAGRSAVLAAGGQAIGEVVALQTATGATVTWCYVTDPEGNIIELQRWSR
jgi:catechol 2,3-dioxygenase-like lactoylglutathione lyase family enzyme